MTARALPATMIDVIRDGTPPSELRTRGERAVFGTLVSTAISAQQRCWPYSDWHALVSERGSRLGAQVWMKRGRTERSSKDFNRILGLAWERAAEFVAEAEPAYDRDRVLAEIAAFRDRVASLEINDQQRAILDHAADVAEARGTTRPALPRRAVMEATGLGERSVRTAMRQLDRDGLLSLAVRGRPGGPKAVRRRATCYQVGPTAGTHIPVPEVRSVGPLGTGSSEKANYVGPLGTSQANYVGPPCTKCGGPLYEADLIVGTATCGTCELRTAGVAA